MSSSPVVRISEEEKQSSDKKIKKKNGQVPTLLFFVCTESGLFENKTCLKTINGKGWYTLPKVLSMFARISEWRAVLFENELSGALFYILQDNESTRRLYFL